jgi:Zn-dependent metalloprotease
VRNITHPSCSVIPSHILRHVAEHGDSVQRKRAAATLTHMAYLTRQPAAAFLGGMPSAASPNQKQRFVYDAIRRRILPGKLVMSDTGKVTTDIEAVEAFDGSGVTYDFYATVYQRNSIDDRGMRLDSTVHYGKDFENALWDGKQMIYGDGDGRLFLRFTAAPDVIGHELTHGVTQHTAGLAYQGQSGALNEHISDAGGIMVKQFLLNQNVRQSDWLIGAGLFGPQVHGKALRSMKAPGTAYDDPVLGKDPQPAHMRDYVQTGDDNGGVHINSGIPNHAFYLVSMALGQFSWLVAGRIWYEVMKQKRVQPNASFQDFADATVIMAGEIYTSGGGVQAAVARAWDAVGLPVSPSLTAVPVALGEPEIEPSEAASQ